MFYLMKYLFLIILFLVLSGPLPVSAAKEVRFAPTTRDILPPPTEGQPNLQNNANYEAPGQAVAPDEATTVPAQSTSPVNPKPKKLYWGFLGLDADTSSHPVRNILIILIIAVAVVLLVRHNSKSQDV
jgi:hypothetical protein